MNKIIQSRCAYLTLTAVMALLVMTSGTAALGAAPFTGKLQEVTITDASTTSKPPTPVLKYSLNGNAVTVDASGSSANGSITQYSWDFGDGTKATGAIANHQYASSGSYPLTLTVVDNAGGISIAQQQVDLSTTLFYWSVDSLPNSSPIISDIGNVTITKSSNSATSAPGFKGNCMQQTGNNQYYNIPLTTVPVANGAIRMYVRHDTAPESTDAFNRYFFKSTNDERANSLYAYIYKSTIYFYIYDSNGNYHRVYNTVTWQTGTWYLYEFRWDAATGALEVKRNGSTLMQTTTTNWTAAIPSWSGQNLNFGYVYPIGSLDEIFITN